MSVPPEQFARVAGRVNLDLLSHKLVVIVGVGTVGSLIAEELANSGIGRLQMMDGDTLEEANLVRHSLPRPYLNANKAEAMALHLSDEFPTLRTEASARYVDSRMIDAELDGFLEEADLIVAATGDGNTQQRLGRRALALDIPAIFPALYTGGGGEVFVQRSPRLPCFLCWDAARRASEPLRGVTALKAETLGIIQLAVYLSIGILDSTSSYADLFLPPRDDPRPRQLFIQTEYGLAMRAIDRRPGCPACRVGPASVRQVENASRSEFFANTSPVSVSVTSRRRRRLVWLGSLTILLLAIIITALGNSLSLNDSPSHPASEAIPAKLLITGTRIGIVKVYMTPEEVKGILGPPLTEQLSPFEKHNRYVVPGGILEAQVLFYGSPQVVALTTNSSHFKTNEHFGVGSSISEIAEVYEKDRYQRGEAYAEYVPLERATGDPEISQGSRAFRYCPTPCELGEIIEFSTSGHSSRVAWVSINAYF